MQVLLMVVFIAFVILGVSISFALGFVSFAGIAALPIIPNSVVFTKMFNGLNSFTLLAVPLFIIPPSITMVVFAGIANVGTGALFMTGLIPGIMLGLAMMGVVVFYSRRKNFPKGERIPTREMRSPDMEFPSGPYDPGHPDRRYHHGLVHTYGACGGCMCVRADYRHFLLQDH